MSKEKIAVVCFTWPGDYPIATRFLKNLKDCVDRIFFCIESSHVNFPLPDWVTPLVMDFNRCQHLQGAEAIIGMRNVYAKLESMGYEVIIKIDSDTWLLRPNLFIDPIINGVDFAYIRRLGFEEHTDGHKWVRCASGPCYALNRSVIGFLTKYDNKEFDKILFKRDRHEDLVFSELINTDPYTTSSELNFTRMWWAHMPYRKPDCILAHFGYCSLERIQEEVKLIRPDLYDFVYSDENEEYLKTFYKYCESVGLEKKQFLDYFDRNGEKLYGN